MLVDQNAKKAFTITIPIPSFHLFYFSHIEYRWLAPLSVWQILNSLLKMPF